MKRTICLLLVTGLLAVPGHASASDDTPSGPPMALRAWSDGPNVTLEWEPPATSEVIDVDLYNVYEIDPTGRVALLGSTPETGFVADKLDGSDAVVYVVTAVNGAGESLPSNPASVFDGWPHCNPIQLSAFPPVETACFFPLPQLPPQ